MVDRQGNENERPGTRNGQTRRFSGCHMMASGAVRSSINLKDNRSECRMQVDRRGREQIWRLLLCWTTACSCDKRSSGRGPVVDFISYDLPLRWLLLRFLGRTRRDDVKRAVPGCGRATDRVGRIRWTACRRRCRYDIDQRTTQALFLLVVVERGLLFLSNLHRICSQIASACKGPPVQSFPTEPTALRLLVRFRVKDVR